MTTPMFHRAIAITNRRRPVHSAIPTNSGSALAPPRTPSPSLPSALPSAARRHRSRRRTPLHRQHGMPASGDTAHPPDYTRAVAKRPACPRVLP